MATIKDQTDSLLEIVRETALTHQKTIGGGTSIADVAKIGRVQPFTVVSGDLAALPELYDILHGILNVYTSIYLQAVSVVATKLIDTRILKILDSVNPDRDLKTFLSTMSVPSTESFIVDCSDEELAYNYRRFSAFEGLEYGINSPFSKKVAEMNITMESFSLALEAIGPNLTNVRNVNNSNHSSLDPYEPMRGIDNGSMGIHKYRLDERKYNHQRNKDTNQRADRLRERQEDYDRRTAEREQDRGWRTSDRAEDRKNQLDDRTTDAQRRLEEEFRGRNWKIEDRNQDRTHQLLDRNEDQTIRTRERAEDVANRRQDKMMDHELRNIERQNDQRFRQQETKEANARRDRGKGRVTTRSMDTFDKHEKVVGKVIEVSFQVGESGQDVTVPVVVRLDSVIVPSEVVQGILALNNEEITIDSRWRAFMAGRIEFWKDFVMAQDLITAEKKHMMRDPSRTYASILKRVNNARFFESVSKNVSLNTISGIMIASEADENKIRGDIGGDLDNPKTRNIVFNNSMAMIIVVVDREWERVKMYIRGYDHHTTIPFNHFKGKDGAGSDVMMEMFKTLSNNRVPSF